jgi:hypothetical protein
MQGYCGKVVIDAFDPGLLKSPYTCLPIDFNTADEQDLQVTAPPTHPVHFCLICGGQSIFALICGGQSILALICGGLTGSTQAGSPQSVVCICNMWVTATN